MTGSRSEESAEKRKRRALGMTGGAVKKWKPVYSVFEYGLMFG